MKLFRFSLGVALATMLGACASRAPQPHQLEPDALYQRGVRELEAGEWAEAIRSLEQFATQYPADPRLEEVRYRIGEAYFGKKEYVTAVAEFVRLATDYAAGDFADDARFKACEAYYHLSPKPQLDQEYTRAALEHCESLIGWYPTSEFAPRARELVTSLKEKLAQKLYLSGEYYMKRRAYDSSIIYFDQVVKDYAGTAYAPRALLRLVEVYRALGYREEMETARERLRREYPASAEAKQAETISLATGR